jgi:hypothetical protein
MRGHLLALLIIIPFSIENESLGSPLIFHDLILTASPRTLTKLNFSEEGISRFRH